jgi:hypothetical protein
MFTNALFGDPKTAPALGLDNATLKKKLAGGGLVTPSLRMRTAKLLVI